MRVVTINTWNGISMRGLTPRPIEAVGNKARRAEVLRAQLAELDADVVLMQECVPDPQFSRGIARALGMDHANQINNGGLRVLGVGIPPRFGRGEGLAILTRPSLRRVAMGSRRLHGRGFTSNVASVQLSSMYYAMAVRVRAAERSVVIVNVHLPFTFPEVGTVDRLWEEAMGRPASEVPRRIRLLARARVGMRQRCVERLGRWVRELSSYGSVILGGDFNLAPDHPELVVLLDATGMSNVLPPRQPEAMTWDARRNPNVECSLTKAWRDGSPKSLRASLMAVLDRDPVCLDHVLIGAELADRVRDAGLGFDEPIGGLHASDHFGVWVDLDL